MWGMDELDEMEPR